MGTDGSAWNAQMAGSGKNTSGCCALDCHCPKPQGGDRRADLVHTPLALIERIATPVTPPVGS